MPSHPDTASVVYFTSGEDTTAMLKGFTITGGTGTNNSTFVAITAGGILIYNSSARIENNIIENNNLNSSIYTYGGGILIYDEFDNQIVIKNNVIRDNNRTSADVAAGGGLLFLHVNGNCSILNNDIMNK